MSPHFRGILTADLLVLVGALLLTAACGTSGGGEDAGASCPSVIARDCSAAPSYVGEIAPLVRDHCFPCHEAGGQEQSRDLSTRAGLVRYGSTVVFQLNGCLMPPASAPATSQLSDPERQSLLQWLVCGSPNN